MSATQVFAGLRQFQPPAFATFIESALSQQSPDVASRRFYALRQNRPAWYGTDGLNAEGRIALDAIESAPSDGLDPARYKLAVEPSPGTGLDAPQIAHRDVLLTSRLLLYISDLHRGREEFRHLDSDVDLPIVHSDDVTGLVKALTDRELAEYLRAQAPQSREYDGLRSALIYYRSTSEKGGWTEFPAGLSLDANSASDEQRRLLQARLVFEDKLPVNADPPSRPDIDAACRIKQKRRPESRRS